MISTETRIRKIRDKLNRIGIGEKGLDDAAVRALYSISQCGNLCPAHGRAGSLPGSRS